MAHSADDRAVGGLSPDRAVARLGIGGLVECDDITADPVLERVRGEPAVLGLDRRSGERDDVGGRGLLRQVAAELR